MSYWESIKITEPDVLFKTLATLLTIVGTLIGVIIKYRKDFPKRRGILKADIEILKTLKELDPSGHSCKTVQESIDSRIQEMYSEKGMALMAEHKWGIVKQIALLVFGAVWTCGFGYWTYKLNVDKVGFAWWSLLTGYLTLMGIGIISIAFEQRRRTGETKRDAMKKQIRDTIIETGRAEATITYEEVGKIANLSMANPDHRNQLADILDEINGDERKNGGPMLSVVVVKKDSKRPGKGFFVLAKDLKRQAPDVDDETFFVSELKRVYEYCKSRA